MKSNLEVYINEQTVVKNEIYSAFKEFVECSICKNIIINPVMCMNCQNSYCRKCIEKLPKNDYKCPYGCVNPNYQKKKEKNNILSKLKFKCQKCGKHFLFGDLEKHIDNCEIKKNLGKINIDKNRKKRLKKLKNNEIKKLTQKRTFACIRSKKNSIKYFK